MTVSFFFRRKSKTDAPSDLQPFDLSPEDMRGLHDAVLHDNDYRLTVPEQLGLLGKYASKDYSGLLPGQFVALKAASLKRSDVITAGITKRSVGTIRAVESFRAHVSFDVCLSGLWFDFDDLKVVKPR